MKKKLSADMVFTYELRTLFHDISYTFNTKYTITATKTKQVLVAKKNNNTMRCLGNACFPSLDRNFLAFGATMYFNRWKYIVQKSL